MKNFNKILDSFLIKDTLNPKIWENPSNPAKARMKYEVKSALLRIADEFIEYLGDDVFVDDIVLTGSLSNFNWSEYSDFDLHVLIDFSQYGKQSELYKELFDLKKQLFNDKHNIKIFGYDVELYAQDITEEHTASGVYSVMDGEWVEVPNKMEKDVDRDLLKTKIKSWTKKIDNVIEQSKNGEDGKKLKDIKTKLKEYRKCGLEKGGELAYENLVFKFLRRSGHIEKLFNTQNKLTDKELSIERENKF
jgi:predicted nucleotidyltransferase